MNELKGENLLVIDDFDIQIGEDFEVLKQLNESWKIILISRFPIEGTNELKLENLRKEDYKAIFRQRLDSIELNYTEFDNLINKANDLLGLTPLSVSMLIKLANKPELTFKDVVENILTSWEGKQKIPHKSIGEMIDTSFTKLSELDKKFISHFVILPQKKYSREELIEFFGFFDIQDVITNLKDCVNKLLDIALINQEEDKLFFHPLIKEYIFQKFNPFLKLRFSKDVIIFFSSIKELISKDSVNRALKNMIEYFEDDKEIHNEVILLSSKWNNIEKSKRLGILLNSEINVIENQIKFGLISLIDKREEEIKETLHATLHG